MLYAKKLICMPSIRQDLRLLRQFIFNYAQSRIGTDSYKILYRFHYNLSLLWFFYYIRNNEF